MKRFLKYAVFIIIATIGLYACSREDSENPMKPEESRLATATAASISGFTANWEKDSKFVVGYSSGGSFKTIELNLSEGEGTSTGRFSYDLIGKLPAPSYAFFPASIIEKCGAKISDCNLIWPTEQKYGEQSISNVPMWAKGDASCNLNGPYKFQSIGGILHLSVTGTGSISKIRVISDKPLSGVFQMDETGYVKFDEGSKSVYNNVDIVFNGDIELSDNPTDFYISAPVGFFTGSKIVFIYEEYCEFTYELKDGIEIKGGQTTEIAVSGVKGLGAGKLVRIDSESDIDSDNIIDMISKSIGLEDIWIVNYYLKMFFAKAVHISRIIYITTDVSGELVEASGLIGYQPGNIYSKFVSIQHSTCNIVPAPSYQDFAIEMAPVCIRGNSFIAVMADYLGYGISQTADLQHPYLHKELTCSCCADMLSAAEEYIAVKGLRMKSTDIDWLGYSQGGAATLATLLELENRGGYDDRIHEVWTGAGPYDLVGLFDCYKNKENCENAGFFAYAIRGISCGEHLNINYDNVFHLLLVEKVDLEALFSTKQLNEWHNELGHNFKEIFHPDILALAAAFEKNSIANFPMPRNIEKIRIYHSETDDMIPYACSEALQEAWGGMEIIKLQAKNNHYIGGMEFLMDYSGLEGIANIIIPVINYFAHNN